MVFASRLWLGSRHCSLGIFRDRAVFASRGIFVLDRNCVHGGDLHPLRSRGVKATLVPELGEYQDARIQGGEVPADLE
jgi:hypothetical protein